MAYKTRVGLLAIVFYPDGSRVNSWGTGPIVENFIESIDPPNPSMVFVDELGATLGILVSTEEGACVINAKTKASSSVYPGERDFNFWYDGTSFPPIKRPEPNLNLSKGAQGIATAWYGLPKLIKAPQEYERAIDWFVYYMMKHAPSWPGPDPDPLPFIGGRYSSSADLQPYIAQMKQIDAGRALLQIMDRIRDLRNIEEMLITKLKEPLSKK